jgi:hypothetical protein
VKTLFEAPFKGLNEFVREGHVASSFLKWFFIHYFFDVEEFFSVFVRRSCWFFLKVSGEERKYSVARTGALAVLHIVFGAALKF